MHFAEPPIGCCCSICARSEAKRALKRKVQPQRAACRCLLASLLVLCPAAREGSSAHPSLCHAQWDGEIQNQSQMAALGVSGFSRFSLVLSLMVFVSQGEHTGSGGPSHPAEICKNNPTGMLRWVCPGAAGAQLSSLLLFQPSPVEPSENQIIQMKPCVLHFPLTHLCSLAASGLAPCSCAALFLMHRVCHKLQLNPG